MKRNNFFLLLALVGLMFLVACKSPIDPINSSPGLPAISTIPPMLLDSTTVLSGGDIISDGGSSIIVRGVVWSTSSDPTINLTTRTIDGTGGGNFSSKITGLAPNSTFYLRAYATNSVGSSYGETKSFKTGEPVLPVVTTSNIDYITTTTAQSGGNVISDGGSSITARGVVWSTSSDPTINLATRTVDGTGNGNFSSKVTGLTPNSTFYLRAYATNNVGTNYGETKNFKTGVLKVGDLFNGGIIFSIDSTSHGLTFQELPGWKNWEDSKAIASSMGGSLPTIQQLLLLYSLKTSFPGLTEEVYWSSEEATDDNRFAISVAFNLKVTQEFNGKEFHSLKGFINSILVIRSF